MRQSRLRKQLVSNDSLTVRLCYSITRFKYVQDLRTMCDVYIKPLRRLANGDSPIISSDEIIRLFSVAEQILGVNDTLLTKINEGLEEKRLSVLIGEVFCEV